MTDRLKPHTLTIRSLSEDKCEKIAVVLSLLVFAHIVSVTAQESNSDPETWITVIPVNNLDDLNAEPNISNGSISTMGVGGISIPLFCPSVGNVMFSVGPRSSGFAVFRRLTGFSSSSIPFTCPEILGCIITAGTVGPTVAVDIVSSNGSVLISSWCSGR